MRETEPNPIDAALAAFMESPVMIILGSCDDFLLPQIGRAAGAVVDTREGRVDLMVCAREWPMTVANVRQNGRLSVTFARPGDYVSYQAKGRASVIAASDAHRKRAKGYIEAMVSTLVALGLDRSVAARWFADRELVALSLLVEMVFVQTPGEKAGRMLERRR
jgi:hypothetical protein